MALRSILVAFSGDVASCSALRFALRLQQRDGAHVTGVVWHGPLPLESRHRAFLSKGVARMLSGREDEAAARIRHEFEAQVAALGSLDQASFIDLHEVESFSLPRHARAYDLVVMTRHAAEVGREHAEVRPDIVALRGGRPVITVPDDFTGGAPAHVALAWDGKRAATRALSDLLNVFGGVEKITLVTIAKDPEPKPEAGDDIMAYLQRHGITANHVQRAPGRRRITQMLLDTSAELGADMLVMGAYEHSKFTEDLLGGVTRDILTDARLPVMMSH
ncbi:MAG: universal stress protein [Rhodobacteraceae bacterium]|nr:MAG: universal stress protein [Paracoccaceae bacterium]